MQSSYGSKLALTRNYPSTAALLVAVATAIGFALRVALVDQSLSSDELSSYWVVTRHTGLSGVWDVVHSDAEITPPLYFLLAKLTTQIGATPAMMRLPSLLAGTASIPLTYLVGKRTLGRQVGVAAATLAAVSPFMINYSIRGAQLRAGCVLRPALNGGLAAGPGRRRGWLVGALRRRLLRGDVLALHRGLRPCRRRRSGRYGRIPAPADR